ncbi:hypothetical protein [Bacillus sp. Cr_A10]|uniref:hypothetical protein n=1 Tax=Bacillus sp. Cr_A10 TaxID=3033993 RepID=UPI0023DC7E65|nr:hypothetical protein [Bacillus sp. Cr_A10]MDF2066308.1 hypothetical protein [Bacillus sp. Cr_A10]
MQKTFAIPAGVATFHSTQLLSAFHLENHYAINIRKFLSLKFFQLAFKKIVEKGDTPAGIALAEDPAVVGKAI